MLRKTLGWCDSEGRPQSERHLVSYSDLEQAGISRDMIRGAMDEAIQRHFLRCVRLPQSKGLGKTSASGLYELNWDERPEYVKDPSLFKGFFAGEGNRTYVPNQFFDHVIQNETLAVVKVVGAVIRFSIGFQNKWGHRRQNIALSYLHIQRYSHIASRATLRDALILALKKNYIQRVEEGHFDPAGGRLSKVTVYALKWLNHHPESSIGQKTVPANSLHAHRSEIRTGIGQKNEPADRSENRTGSEIKQINKTLKQQDAALLQKLRQAGFDAYAAEAIANKYPMDRIERQIQWIDERKVKSNRLGLLRMAIDHDWPAPVGSADELRRRNFTRESGVSFDIAVQRLQERFGISS